MCQQVQVWQFVDFDLIITDCDILQGQIDKNSHELKYISAASNSPVFLHARGVRVLPASSIE